MRCLICAGLAVLLPGAWAQKVPMTTPNGDIFAAGGVKDDRANTSAKTDASSTVAPTIRTIWAKIRTQSLVSQSLVSVTGVSHMLENLLNEVEGVNWRIEQLLEGDYTVEKRLTLTLAYLNLCLDHHASMVLLMRNGRNGSAMALVRLVFEAMIRAHWVVKCASNDQVDAVAEDDGFMQVLDHSGGGEVFWRFSFG